MLSLTLWPAGLDRSRMRRHFPGWWHLGMTPKRLTWRTGSGGWEKGPPVCLSELPIASSCWRGLKSAEAIFLLPTSRKYYNWSLKCRWKQTIVRALDPLCNFGQGWWRSSCCNQPRLMGVSWETGKQPEKTINNQTLLLRRSKKDNATLRLKSYHEHQREQNQIFVQLNWLGEVA